MDVDGLLQPRGEDLPSGENLEYASDFIAMELAAQPGEERRMGDAVIEGADPDWRDLSEKALAVLEQAHDIRAAGHLTLALLNLRGIPGFADGVAYVRGCLEQWWDSCHPQLDADDDDDPTMRINAVLMLADPDRMQRALRLAPLTESRAFGRFSLRDILIAEGEIALPEEAEPAVELSTISAAFQDTNERVKREMVDALARIAGDLRAIDAVFSERTPGQGPDLDPLSRMVHQMQRRFDSLAGLEPEDGTGGATQEADVDDDAPQAAPVPRAAAGGGSAKAGGPIATRAEVIAAFDQIIAYYTRNEPSSPLVMLVERAKALVGADFLTIIKELAPSGLDHVHMIGGIRPEDEY